MKIKSLFKSSQRFKRNSLYDRVQDQMNKADLQQQSFDPIRSIFLKYRNNNDLTKGEIYKKNLEFIQSQESQKKIQQQIGESLQDYYQRVDQEADLRLDEIAKSNISREQILGLKKQGPAIKSNPFFNMIKNDHQIRKSYLKNKAEYNVQNIVELAIKQDIGYDEASSSSGKRVVLNYEDEQNPLKKRYSRKMYLKNNMLKEADSQDYFSTRQDIDQTDYQRFDILESYRPIERIDYYKKDIHIPKEQIHWRNTPLLSQFMSVYGNIKHRKHTRLDFVSQQRVEKAIKQARKLRLLPTFSYLKSYHKKPLKTLEEDIENETNIEIDLDSGMICRKLSEPEIDFSRSKNYYRHTLMYYNKLQTSDKDLETENLFEDATNYVMLEKKEEIEKKNIEYINEIIYTEALPKFRNLENLDKESLKESYIKLQEKIKDISYQDFLYLLISEFTQDQNMLQNIIDVSRSFKNKELETEETYEEILDQLEDAKKQFLQQDKVSNKKEIDFLTNLFMDEFKKSN